MGLMGKLFGIGEKGKITLTVDKPSYIAGELIVGLIHITVFEPIECDAVVLKATGKEKVKWTEEKTETDGNGHTKITHDHHTKDKEFFKQKIVVSAIPHTYAPGNYSYPFEYQLPPDLPGVFYLDKYSEGHVHDLRCKISYKLKATLDIQGFLARDLKASCELVVHEQLTKTIQPSHDVTTQNVYYLCCFNKGTCHLEVTMDKNVYFPGETAQILCKIENGSQVDITGMSCKLLQDIELSAHGHPHRFTRTLCRQRFPGVPASSTLTQPQPLALVPGSGAINPSTTGRLIKCSYRVDIECDIPWCPDVHLVMPLTVIAPAVMPVHAPWGSSPSPLVAEPM